MTGKGRNLFTGLPETFEITSEDVTGAIKETADKICAAVKAVIARTDPDLVSDINSDGIYLTGGGSLLSGFAQYLSEYLGTKVRMLEDPTHSVVRGAASALRRPDLLKNVNYPLRSITELEIT